MGRPFNTGDCCQNRAMNRRDRERLAEARLKQIRPPLSKHPPDQKPLALKLFLWWLVHKIFGGGS